MDSSVTCRPSPSCLTRLRELATGRGGEAAIASGTLARAKLAESQAQSGTSTGLPARKRRRPARVVEHPVRRQGAHARRAESGRAEAAAYDGA